MPYRRSGVSAHMHGVIPFFVHYQQNRRLKVLNREALRLCRGAWHSKIW